MRQTTFLSDRFVAGTLQGSLKSDKIEIGEADPDHDHNHTFEFGDDENKEHSWPVPEVGQEFSQQNLKNVCLDLFYSDRSWTCSI